MTDGRAACRDAGLRALCVVVLCLLSAESRSAERVLLRDLALGRCALLEPVNALGPIKPNGIWTQEDDAIVATGAAAPWTIQVAGDATWTDYRVSVNVTIRKPTPKADFPIYHAEFDRYLPRDMFPPLCQHTGQYRYRYFAGEFDWGSDAAVFVRHQNRNDCYRVQLSTQYQEIILWHGIGGYLQVVPCELKTRQTYKLEVLAQGSNIRVLLDGQEKISYYHATLPTLAGRIGLGAYQATVAFQDVTVVELPPATAHAPSHQPRFRTRRWRTLRWIFDGNEPICLMEKVRAPIDPNAKDLLYYYFVKLRPGYRPYYHGWIAVWPRHNLGRTVLVGDEGDIRTTGEGTDTLVLDFDGQHRKGIVRVHHTDRLTYDRVRGTYRHQMTSDVEFLEEVTTTVFEFFDPLTYNNKFPGRGVRHRWLPSGHEWGIVSGEDGKRYRHPISQSLHMWGQNGWLSAPGNGFWMLYPDRAACPVFEYEVDGGCFLAEVCHWGYDWHQRIRWPKSPKKFRAGDRLKIRFAMTAYPPREAERIFLAAPLHVRHASPPKHARRTGSHVQLHPPTHFAFPVCDPGGTDFTRLHNVREPFVGWPFRGQYTLDTAVGHDDDHSLRLDGPAKVNGQFYHHMIDGYAKRYLCTLWLKTKGAVGEGLEIKLQYSFRDAPCDIVETHLTGDNDWQQVSFVTTLPAITFETYDSTTLFLTLKGKGTAWVDDFSVRPIEEGEEARDQLPTNAKLTRVPPPPKPDWSK